LQTKNIFIVIVAVVVLGAVGIGAYFLGSTSSRTTVAEGVTTPGNGGSAGGYTRQGPNYSTIIEELKTRLAENPGDPAVTEQLGHAFFEQKRFNEAVTWYKKTIELAGDDADIYNDIGLSMHYSGNSAEGLKYIDKGIEKNPYNQRIWLTKGFLMAYGMGDMNGAKAAFEKAAALDPTSQIGKAASDYLAQINAN
jgi:tetratricopeptide (TPR) repeat protein